MAQGGRDVLSSMENTIKGNQLYISPHQCIFRTPSILLKHRKEAYVPNCFSFGPFHHDQPNLKVTEKIKLEYLRDLLCRLGNPEKVLRELLDSINDVEGKARDCYAGIIDQDVAVPPNFVEILVVDGCFIIELFRKYVHVARRQGGDLIFSMSCMLQILPHDLILLENQIPWFVLEILFEKTKAPSETYSLIKIALRFLKHEFLLSPGFPLDRILDLPANQKVNHILDLLRLMLVLPSKEVKNYQENRQHLEWKTIPSATRLQEAGVKFVSVDADSILDMKFTNGALQIPHFLIQEITETSFRNLISYEQCLPNCSPIFTCYAKIMDNLIDTSNDMEILCKEKIFDSWMGPEDAAQFFNKLHNDTNMKEFYLCELSNALNNHCQQLWPKWRAAYVQNYFTKPWAMAAQIYAIIMFILTFWQAYKSD